MTHIAVVSGAAARLAEVSHELELAGVRAIPASRTTRLQTASVDAYIQLPLEAVPGTSSLVALRRLLYCGLITRLDTLSEILPSIRPDGHVVLVGGDALVDRRAPDAARARFDLLRTVAAVLNEEHKVRTVVVDPLTSPQAIARIVRDAKPSHHVTDSLADLSPELSHTEWLREALSYAGDSWHRFSSHTGSETCG
jgi:hypothetical protein